MEGVLLNVKLSEVSKTSLKSFTYLKGDLGSSESLSLYSCLVIEMRPFFSDFGKSDFSV